jgi:hypothetical protein
MSSLPFSKDDRSRAILFLPSLPLPSLFVKEEEKGGAVLAVDKV